MTHEKLKELSEKLENGIISIFESEDYKKYLDTFSKFHSYSLNNTILIALAKPDATLVAGYNTWKKLKRNVKVGEKSIKIIAPYVYKTEENESQNNSEQNYIVKGFKTANVFDISQTEGEPLPEISHKLKDTVENYNVFMEAIKQVSPVPIIFDSVKSSANGYYSSNNKMIVIDKDMSEPMHCKTAIHELAHATCHDKDISQNNDIPEEKSVREVQAESIAYIVCQYFGIDTSDYSFGYVAGWSKDRDITELKGSMEIIKNSSKEIIDNLEEKMKNIFLEKSKDNLKTDKNVSKKTKRCI